MFNNNEKYYLLYSEKDNFLISTKYLDIEMAIQEAKRICNASRKTITILVAQSVVKYVENPVEHVKL